ncbi:Uncharacterised protein [Halioglobus japonicus]|nr:Uncharacterised protein [Halioglobus japonicus]
MSAKTIRLALLAVPLLVALLLIVSPEKLKEDLQDTNIPQCTEDDALCILSGDILRDMSNLKWAVEREKFDKQTLPILNIYLTDGALKKLYKKRRDTLDKPGQILMGEDDDWVDATVIADDGEPSHKLKAELRLKGDWVDHIEHPTKISFRIKIRKQGYVFGMKRFSIQHPKTRKYQAEALLMDEMRRWGIVAPRYQFVDVRINDYAIGVMALEEHFSKELLEAQTRREGPIVILDEDLMWRQRDLNVRSNTGGDPKAPGKDNAHIFMRDLAISQFSAPAYVPGSTATNNSVRAMSLYRDFMDGKLPADEVFDVQKVARWWVLMNTWYGCHGQAAHNRRFYFNPTTNLLEPIAFDNGPVPHERSAKTENCDRMVAPLLRGDPNFQRYVLAFAEELLEAYSSPEWQEQYHESQIGHLQVLAMEDMPTRIIYTENILNNLSYFLDNMKLKAAPRVVSDKNHPFVTKWPDAPLYSHVRAFLFPEGDGMALQLKNLSADTLSNVQILLSDGTGELAVVKEFGDLPAYQKKAGGKGSRHLVDIALEQPFVEGTMAVVQYQYRGETYTEDAVTQFRNHVSGFARNFRQALSGKAGVQIDPSAKSIVFGPGDHSIDHSLELDKGWAVTLQAGSRLKMENGATLKVRGPLFLLGTQESPVKVEVVPSPGFQGVGAWGGILVSQAETRSKVQHALLTGVGSTTIANRQDYYGITGCISFYESDVEIANATFDNMHCEDALNIVRADFTITDSTIRRTAFDGFDSDFSVGLIRDSLFELTGNDAVDVSGTSLTLREVDFLKIGDKSISVGEESNLDASGVSIDGTSSGVASKDLSVAVVRDSSFNNITGSALITYIKKNEYGSASIECTGCTFSNYGFLATNERGSQIVIDGVAQPVTNFNKQQLVEAGFATE